MSIITLVFDQPLVLPADGAGLTITDDSGGAFTVSSVLFGPDSKTLVYDGSWAPDDPINGTDVVTVAYSQAVGDLIGTGGMEVRNFTAVGQYLIVNVSSMLSQRGFYSFDIQQTLHVPASIVSAEFNNIRFNV